MYICCCLLAKLCPFFVTPWTVARQAPLFMGFPRQEYWSRLPFPSPWKLSDPGSEPTSSAWQFSVCVPAQSLSHVQLYVTPWTVARQAPLSMGFSRQEYWSGLPCPPLGDIPNQGLNPGLPYCRQILYRLSHQGSPECPIYRSPMFRRGRGL